MNGGAMEFREDLLQVRAPGVTFYVLRDQAGLWLIDTGFVFGRSALRRALVRRGWEGLPVRGILLTHGHLDHILNVGRFAVEFDALVLAPRLDAAYYTGRARYQGLSRITGGMEALGRLLLGFRSFEPDQWLDDGKAIEVWGGLRAVHLPGHTPGLMGFFSETRQVLFCGDLFASYGRQGWLPPAILNHDIDQLRGSIQKALGGAIFIL